MKISLTLFIILLGCIYLFYVQKLIPSEMRGAAAYFVGYMLCMLQIIGFEMIDKNKKIKQLEDQLRSLIDLREKND